MNKVTLIGRLCNNFELKTIKKGDKSYNLAENIIEVSRKVHDYSGETRTETNYIPFTVWGRQAEKVAKELKRDVKVEIIGSLDGKTVNAGEKSIPVLTLAVNNIKVVLNYKK